jgi:DNA-directed RNA polymerase subunit B
VYEAEAKQYPGGMKDIFEIPSSDANIRGYRGEKAYRLLESDGSIMHESVVTGGDILILLLVLGHLKVVLLIQLL